MNDETYTPCTKCGRPMAYCKGQCCGQPKGCECREYGPMKKGCIRQIEPSCPYEAVIPTLTVEDKSNIKDLADCFVHVSNINTTFYIDDKHRMIVTWAGPVEYDNYDLDANSLGLRSQFLIDPVNERGAYYDKTGNYQSFDFGGNSAASLRLAFEIDIDVSTPANVTVAGYTMFGNSGIYALIANTGNYNVKITKITDVMSGTVYYDFSAGVNRLADLHSDVAAAGSVAFDIPHIGGTLTYAESEYSWEETYPSETTRLTPFNQYTITTNPDLTDGYGFWGFAGLDGEGLVAPPYIWEVKIGKDAVVVNFGITRVIPA